MRNQFKKCRSAGKGLCWLLVWAFLSPLVLRADQIVYDDALENGWMDWGWASINYNNTSPVHSGSKSISVTITDSSWLKRFISRMELSMPVCTRI